MTRMAGPDFAVMCNSINRHIHTHTHTQDGRWKWGRKRRRGENGNGGGDQWTSRRRERRRSGDGNESSSGDGDGIGEGRVGAKTRKKPHTSCRRDVKNGGNLGGEKRRKKNVDMAITYSRVWINRVRLPILLVVS